LIELGVLDDKSRRFRFTNFIRIINWCINFSSKIIKKNRCQLFSSLFKNQEISQEKINWAFTI